LQKGGKGKKGKKKGDDGEEGVELTPEEREARAKLRIEALERELVQRQDTVNRALTAHNDVRQRQAELLKDFEVALAAGHTCCLCLAHVRMFAFVVLTGRQQCDVGDGRTGREADDIRYHCRHDQAVQEHAGGTHASH
jgi:hypothetical protein